MSGLRRCAAAAVVGLLVLLGASTPASAAAQPVRHLVGERLVADFWKALLRRQPADVDPYICLHYDGVLSPFTLDPQPAPQLECRAQAGEPLVIYGTVQEYSVWEADHDGRDASPAGLRSAVLAAVGDEPPVGTYDGRPLHFVRVITGLQTAELPPDGFFPVRRTQFVAGAWLAIRVATPGEHIVVLPTTRTTITVQPGCLD